MIARITNLRSRLFHRRPTPIASQDTHLAFWSEKLPLALAMLAQAAVICRWYIGDNPPESVAATLVWVNVVIAVAAGVALDLVVVTTVMARRRGRRGPWGILTAAAAAAASALISLDVYGGWTPGPYLHIAYPVVVFLFSMHLSSPRIVAHNRPLLAQRRTLIVRLVQLIRTVRAELHTVDQVVAHLRDQLAQQIDGLAQAGADLALRDTTIARLQQVAAQASANDVATAREIASVHQQLAQARADTTQARATLAQREQEATHARDHAAQQEQEAARVRQQLAQQASELATLSHTVPDAGDLDITAIAQRFKDLGMSWRDIEGLLHIPQSTLRARLKARTNGHLVEV